MKEFLITFPVLFGLDHVVVVIPVKFYSQFQSRTIKIQNVIPSTVLTTKLETSYLFFLQPVPKGSFSRCPMSAEFTPIGFQFRSIEHVNSLVLFTGFQRPLTPSNLRGGIGWRRCLRICRLVVQRPLAPSNLRGGIVVTAI